MIEIKHIINDPLGLHARPAGQLVKQAAAFACNIQVGTSNKLVDAKRIMGVMGLALKQGNEMIMTFDGADEQEAAKAVQEFLLKNL